MKPRRAPRRLRKSGARGAAEGGGCEWCNAADLNLRVGFDGLGVLMAACAAAHIRGGGDPGGGKGGAYDAVIDFGAVVSDGSSPPKLRPEFASGDGLHPNSAEDRDMAAAVGLATLRV